MKNKILFKLFSILVLFVIVALTVSFTNQESTKWKLVYENSSFGRRISGNIDDLISEALNGSDIKVILHFDSSDLHYQMQLSKVKVDICSSIVTGYNYDFRQNPQEKNIYSRISTYSSNGEYISVYEENSFYKNPELINVSMSWYASN